MYALLKLTRNIQKISEGKIFLLTFSNPKLKSLVVKLNKDQLRASQLSNDTDIPFVYSQASEAFGKTPGKKWTLHDTGDLYDSFKVTQVTEDFILEYGDLEKEDRDFNELFNGNVLGMNSESMEILQKEAIPVMKQILLQQMLKGI